MLLDAQKAASPADEARAAALASAYEGLKAEDMLRRAVREDFAGEIALVSSFGAESAVLLALLADIDRSAPVLFLETGMHFPETRAYRRRLIEHLGLRNVRTLRPDLAKLATNDPDGTLNARDTDACCHIRKVEPLEKALEHFGAWITGRKRGQSSTRAAMAAVETDGVGRFKVNPLAQWTRDDVADFMRERQLPRHPLVAKGYPSIGCAPCTTPVAPGEDPRAGRWRNEAKTECGIHIVYGKVVRVPASDAGPMDRKVAV